MPAAFCVVDTDVGTVETPFPSPKEPTPPRYSKQPVIDRIKGILLVPRQEYVDQKNTWGVCGLHAHDVCVPGGMKGLCECLEPLFMNQPLTQELLQKLKEEIVLYYRSHHHPVVAVYVPEQDVTDGVLQIVVLEGCVGQIAASGNCWFSSRFYERSIRLGSGEAITSDTLLTDVAWINRNPFRDVDVVFTPGCDPGTTNIELIVCDRFPLQVYAGADNTGTSPSGTARYFAGATWGNAFWLDQVLTYQYTTSNDFNEFQGYEEAVSMVCDQYIIAD